MATEAWCDTCNTEPTAGMFCESCVEAKVVQARAEGERDCDPQNCDRCCDECAAGNVIDAVREYADRRKMLGFMSPEVFAAFGELVDELEGR